MHPTDPPSSAESKPAVAAGAVPTPSTDGSSSSLYRAEEVAYHAPVSWPAHERAVEIDVDLGLGPHALTTLGSDLTHEYVSVNADYRS